MSSVICLGRLLPVAGVIDLVGTLTPMGVKCRLLPLVVVIDLDVLVGIVVAVVVPVNMSV